MIENKTDAFEKAVRPISAGIKNVLLLCGDEIKKSTYEIRLRANRPVILYGERGSVFLSTDSKVTETIEPKTVICSPGELKDTFGRMCGYSIHTHQTSINNGFVTLPGGHRVGVAGTAVCDQSGNIISVRDISSLNIRIARDFDGCSQEIINKFFAFEPVSIMIAGPPSSGKTTMLKDAAKKLSSGDGCKCFKVTVVDERQELASGMSMGVNCDVLSSYPKEKAVLAAVRTLSPQIIICDEIGDDSEVKAIEKAVNTGVRFVVTVHASSKQELLCRPQIENLMRTYSFEKVVMLCGDKPCRIKEIFEVGDLLDEIDRRRADLSFAERSGNDSVDIS